MFKSTANFMILCAGASQEILEQCPKSERIKQIGIGATIVLTSTLAFFSGSYALYTIFGNIFIALAFGVVWSLVIYNLDRLIVSSMRKTVSFGYQVLAAIPRLILAVLIAVVISKPIEIRLLETKINKVLFESNKAAKEELSKDCQTVEDDFEDKIKSKRDQIALKENSKPSLMLQLEQQLADKNEKRRQLSSTISIKNTPIAEQISRLEREISFYQSNGDNNSDNDRKIKTNRQEIKSLKDRIARNRSPLRSIDQEIKELENQKEEEFAYYQEELETLRSQNNSDIEALRQTKTEELEACKIRQKKGGDLYDKNSLPDLIVALNRATDEDSIMSRISLFIMALFIMLETAPVFVKLIMPRGPYDEILNAMEHEVKINALEQINKRNHKLNQEIELLTSIDQTQMEQEVSNNKKVLQTISDAHHELIKEQVSIWLEKEKRKLTANGSITTKD